MPGNTNHVLLSELFHVQSSRWSKLAEAHINNIHQVVDEFMQAALEHVVREEGVRWEISQLILESLDRNARAGRSELDRLLEDEKQQPITYNHYYTDNIQKSRQDFLRNSIENKMFVDNVCKRVVERHLIRNMPKVFQPESIILLSDEDPRRVAAEPFGNTEKR